MSFFTYLVETEDLVSALSTSGLPGFPSISANYSGVSEEFQLSNLQESDISKSYKSSPVTGGYGNVISINFGSSRSWNHIAFINHNFDPSIVITVRASNVGFFSFTFTTTMTYREFDMFLFTSATRTEQYVQILIVDTITAAHDYSIGRLIIGLATTLTSNFSYNWQRRRKALNRSKRSDVNARMVNRIVRFKELVLSFSEMTDDQENALTAFTDALEGDALWCFLVPNPDVYEGYVMTLSGDVVETLGRRHSVTLTFSEESRGVRISA